MTLDDFRAMRGEARSFEELNDRIQHDGALRNEIRAMYKTLFGEQITGCVRCLADAFIRIVNYRSPNVPNLSLIFLMVFILTSCGVKRGAVVEVPSVRIDSVYVAHYERDSVYVKDSVFVKELHDTVFVERFKAVEVYKVLRDTAAVQHTDSVTVVQTVEVEKVRNSVFARICIAIVLGLLAFVMMGVVLRLRI